MHKLLMSKTSTPISMPTAMLPTTLAPLPEDLLQYLSPYKVLVCTSCRYAIQPKAIVRHLKDIHRINSSGRQPFMQHVQEFELAEHELVVQYQPGEFPVPLLPIHDGLQCRFEDCTYLCVAEKRMKHHWLSVHGRQGRMASDWQTAPLQSFFMGNLLRYFTGTPSEKPTERIIAQIASQSRTEEKTLPDASISFSPISKILPRTLNESDNLIMRHFISHTWLTLATGENTRQMWHVLVPQLAYQHEFLMHALMACTALHMAYLYPDQHSDLIIKARIHQDQAMPLFRDAISSLENETCDSVYIFALLVAVSAFALDELSYMSGGKEDKLPSWLFFIRSGCTMLCDVWDRIGTGPVRCLVESWQILEEISEFPHQPLLDYLLAIPHDDWPEEVRVPYNDSALALARTFSCMHTLDRRITALDVVRFWPIKNSIAYAELLSNWHPGALILLAYYCGVLHRVEARTWYLRGKAASMLSTIVRRLDPKWHRYIEWPLSEVGLPPSKSDTSFDLPLDSSEEKAYIVRGLGCIL